MPSRAVGSSQPEPPRPDGDGADPEHVECQSVNANADGDTGAGLGCHGPADGGQPAELGGDQGPGRPRPQARHQAVHQLVPPSQKPTGGRSEMGGRGGIRYCSVRS